MIGSDVEVRGLFASQPRLVKAGSVIGFFAFVVFGMFIPPALAVAVVFGVGTPASSWKGTAGALALTTILAAVGAWTSCRFLNWLKGGSLSAIGGALFIVGSSAASAGIAALAAAAHVWPQVFVASLVVTITSLIASFVLTKIGQAISRGAQD